MKNKILKGSIIAFIFIICLMFITVGVSAESNSNNGTTIETLSKGGLSITYPSKASCIQGTLEDGSILFQGVVGADGHWTFGQYRDFSFEDSNTIPLWFKTGKDADGDWTGNSVPVQTNGFGDASVSIPLEVSIDSTDGVLPASSWWSVPVKADIDEDHLDNGSWIQIDVGKYQPNSFCKPKHRYAEIISF